MDGYSSKKSGAGIMAPRKGCNVTFKDATMGRDQNAQFCNRIGCSGRLKYSGQNTRIGSSDRAKFSKPSFCSSNGNEMVGTSSRSSSAMTRVKSSYLDSKRKSPSISEFDSSESSQSGDSEVPELISSPSRSPRPHLRSTNKSVQVTAVETRSSSVPSNVRSQKMFRPKNKGTLPASSVSSVSKSYGLGTLNNSSNRGRYGLKNLKCNSISDVIRPSCSSSDPKSAGKNVMKTRSSEAESSLTRRGRQTAAAVASVNGHVVASSASGEDSSSAASDWRGRSLNVNNGRMRFSYRQNGRNSSSLREPPLRISSPDSERHLGGPSSLQQFSANGSSGSSSSSSYSLSSSNDDNHSSMMPFTSADLGFTHFRNRDSLQHYNLDGIAEILLALERIEQDAELTHEQLLALETGLFLSGLNLYDQHRDMRLDIDNMSYEELLALEERMGTVSTAVSEEALLKCVRRSIYQSTPSEESVSGSGKDGDDSKCSICQEEYVVGNEIGKLIECHHDYHIACINEWLRLKNWCPICKAAAAPTQSSSS
ncbi:hypothetical protein CDL12_22432 [Handroanthus impetiginosus]|uniref:RING-type E3 ubiquitin transferase n=1 Tax=Handroanthus impetiginosus TaxID=429701 RepID=A0A2G9GJ28_9LAMI|nr:hypothetical protein CDL12_22432 [Handroanthus impetiginosus]